MNSSKLMATLSFHAGYVVQIKELCRVLDLSYSGIRPKLAGKVDFRLNEVRAIRDFYHLSDEEVVELFIND